MSKVKVVLDADVIIHFAKGGYLSVLPTILNEYDHIVLDIVYDELRGDVRTQLDNQMTFLKNIQLVSFEATGEMMYEYFRLLENKGKGESACLAYCRYTNNVIGSSNLRDTSDYCNRHGIVYLTTIDFLYYAVSRNLMNSDEAVGFIAEVRNKGSILPDVDFSTYMPHVLL